MSQHNTSTVAFALEYRPRDAERRRSYDARLAMSLAVTLAVAAGLACTWPAVWRFCADFGASPVGLTRWIARASLWVRSEHHMLWVVAIAALIPLAIARIPSTSARRGRLWLVTVGCCVMMTGLVAAAAAWPMIRLHREITQGPGVGLGHGGSLNGPIEFSNAHSLFAYIARDNSDSASPDVVIDIAAGAEVDRDQHVFDTRLWIIAPNQRGGSYYYRGAQGNGMYYAVVPKTDRTNFSTRYTLVGIFEGNCYRMMQNRDELTVITSWHMGAASRIERTYRWNGTHFVEIESKEINDAPG